REAVDRVAEFIDGGKQPHDLRGADRAADILRSAVRIGAVVVDVRCDEDVGLTGRRRADRAHVPTALWLNADRTVEACGADGGNQPVLWRCVPRLVWKFQ